MPNFDRIVNTDATRRPMVLLYILLQTGRIYVDTSCKSLCNRIIKIPRFSISERVEQIIISLLNLIIKFPSESSTSLSRIHFSENDKINFAKNKQRYKIPKRTWINNNEKKNLDVSKLCAALKKERTNK